MDPDKAAQPTLVNTGLELKTITSNSNPSYEMNRLLKSTIQPGNITTVIPTGSHAKRPFQASLRSDSSLDQTLVSFRDVDSAKKISHRRLRILSGVSCVLGLVAVVLAIIDIEVTRRAKARSTPSNIISNGVKNSVTDADPLRLAGIVLKGTLSLLSIATCVAIHQIYMNARRLNIIKNLYHESESFVTTSLFAKYCTECFVCILHIPPLVDDLGVADIYKLQLLVLLRLYLATRCLRERSELFHNHATNLLASVTKTDISTSFLVKTYFLKEPFKLIFTFYTLNVFLGGYCVYVIEESHTYLDTTWMMVVTMTTLGFGDVVPVSVFARGLVGFASVLGIFLMALFISVVHETLQLTQQEKRILAYIENAAHLRQKKAVAARCIQSYWRYRAFYQKNTGAVETGDWLKIQKVKLLRHNFFNQMRLWRSIRRAGSRDDYWKKFFIMDDTAMLLTTVCRTIDNIDRHLGTQQAGKGSKNSLFKNPSLYSPLPKKQDQQEYDRVFEYPSISFASPRSNNVDVQAVLVDSWKSTAQQQQQQQEPGRPDKLVIPVDKQREIPKIYTNHTDPEEGGLEDIRNRRYLLRRPEYLRKTSDLSTSSDHIDRGAMTFDMLQARINSVESSLDQIYGKVKGELRDIRDTIKTMSAPTPARTPLWSPTQLTHHGENSNGDAIFSYANIEKYEI